MFTKPQAAGQAPLGVSCAGGLGRDPSIGISNKLPNDADAAGLGPQLETHCRRE